MATEREAVAYLKRLLKQGCELLERLHANSVQRRKPGTLMDDLIEKPDPGTATRDQIEQWAKQCVRDAEGCVCVHPLQEWQEEREALGFELMCLEEFIYDYITRYLADWVNHLPESARKTMFDAKRLVLEYSGREKQWEDELKMWERGDWEGLLRKGKIGPTEYFVLAQDYSKGNPKFPKASETETTAETEFLKLLKEMR